MSRIIFETERSSLREIKPESRAPERNGLRIEKEIFWRGYRHYV
ncbi:MAG TPA: hypothetical protein VIM99_02070 [Blastocatellia bacterium]